MFVEVFNNRIETEPSDGSGLPGAYGIAHPPALVPMRQTLSQRILAGETAWFMNREYDFEWQHPDSPFRGHIGLGQARNIPLLAQKYQASRPEIRAAVLTGSLAPDAPMQARVDLEYFTVSEYELEEHVPSWTWELKTRARAWLIQSPDALMFPYQMLFGLPWDAGLDPSNFGMPAYDLTATASVQQLRAEAAFKNFVEHAHVAATCALDTPQPVTLGDASASNVITFRNTRIAPSLRGLVITLPTGGFLFLRDARYDLDSGSIRHAGSNGQGRISKKTLAMKIILQVAQDLAWLTHAQSCLGMDYAEGLANFHKWCNTPVAPQMAR